MPGHEGLAFADPDAAQVGHVLALLLKRLQIFYGMARPTGGIAYCDCRQAEGGESHDYCNIGCRSG